MLGIRFTVPYTFARCLRASNRHNVSPLRSDSASRSFSRISPLNTSNKVAKGEDESSVEAQILLRKTKDVPREPGAMSRRLAEATEEAILEGGRAGRKAVEEAGFSEELKKKLLERIEAHKFRSENASAFADANISSNVGRGSRDIAGAQAWTGEESTEDSVLRMLHDARKPLKPGVRGPAKIPTPIIDMRLRRETKQRPGERLANARDKTSIYAISKDAQMSDKEREEMRRDLKERFSPGARAMPNSFRGLAALANERIEDAIARGQFKNIPRGRAIERDARADNPFIDTTEYIMNKMIQRQDIVPPWIEKQQELVKTANSFRLRLRTDWKRIALRTIASRGGSLQEQMQTAELYAASERAYNPKKRTVEQIAVPTNVTDDPVMLNVIQEAPQSLSEALPTSATPNHISVELEIGDPVAAVSATDTVKPAESEGSLDNSASTDPLLAIKQVLPAPFRIPSWEASENSFLTLSITTLNSLTRSYNLMAPDLAKKPYFSLERELRACYADVAPQLAAALRDRAYSGYSEKKGKVAREQAGVLERFAGGKTKVYDDPKPMYGFKEFWKDLFGRKEGER